MTRFNPDIPAFLARAAENQITRQVLPVWSNHVMHESPNAMGAMDVAGKAVPNSIRGSIMNARALWSFSFAYQQTQDPRLLINAMQSYETFVEYFIDKERGGVYWSVDANGKLLDSSKAILSQTYAIYGLSQFYLASNDTQALEHAIELADLVDRHYRRDDGTYNSECNQDFEVSTPDIELETDTCHQLHVLEALTQLYIAKPDAQIQQRMISIIDLFLLHIFPAAKHLPLMFDRQWQPANKARSYGHNFEAPFLIAFACELLNDSARLESTQDALLGYADITLEEGMHHSGSFLYGFGANGKPAETLSWWPQTEASNGLMMAYNITGHQKYLNALVDLWQVIQQHWMDGAQGEWHTELNLELKSLKHNKADLWRCAYHTTRASFILSRGIQCLGVNGKKRPSQTLDDHTLYSSTL